MANNVFFFIKGDLRKCFANLIRHTEVLLKKWIFLTEALQCLFKGQHLTLRRNSSFSSICMYSRVGVSYCHDVLRLLSANCEMQQNTRCVACVSVS